MRKKGMIRPLLLAACLAGTAMAAPLNIVLITADDMNWDSLGCTGSSVPGISPNIDRLASQGILFTEAHATIPVCQPVRATMHTGMFPNRSGVRGFGPLRDDVRTINEVMHEAGFPKGVFNLVTGDGVGVGSQLSSHKDVDMVSFTGSTRAGIAISKAAADTLKRVHLELGGKGANIIFADADDKAVKRGVLHMMNNTGQSCNAPSRMLVQKGIYEKAVETAAEVANSVTVGNAHDAGRHIGPVVNEAQYNKIQGLIQQGIDEGARLVAGGTGRPEGFNRGFFVKPTVFADVTNEMTIAREEIFGPVLSIIPFETEEEAIKIANDTVYGLTNYIQTQDSAKSNRIALQLRSGMVEINGQSRGAGAPFGGMKQSGNGREGGVWGIEDFLEVKSVAGWAAE